VAYQHLIFERQDNLAVITLNRPERANAMHRPLLNEMAAACAAIEADDGIHVVVLTGAGKAFSSGFDLKEQAEDAPQGVTGWRPVLRNDFDAVMQFWHLNKPVIAAVKGLALASGFELACACDITIAGEDAIFGEPELKFGAGIVVMLLPWLTGPKLAKELYFTGADRISARRAFEMGLINRIVPSGEELETALAMARDIAVIDPNLVRQTKLAVNRSMDLMGMGEALEMALEIDMQIEGEGSPDKRAFIDIARREGLRAALAWREARFAQPDNSG
jgi:enoyl-CoA hydratase/carnithine racemase